MSVQPGGGTSLTSPEIVDLSGIGEVDPAGVRLEAGFKQRLVDADAGAHLGRVAVDVHQEKWHRADVEVDGVGFGVLGQDERA